MDRRLADNEIVGGTASEEFIALAEGGAGTVELETCDGATEYVTVEDVAATIR